MQKGSSKVALLIRRVDAAWFFATMLMLVGCDSVLPVHTPQVPNALCVSPATYDFGHVALNDTVHTDFYIVNGTSDSFHVQSPELKLGTKFQLSWNEWVGGPAGRSFTSPPILKIGNDYIPANFPPIVIQYASQVHGTFYDTLIFRDADDTNRILLSAPVEAQSP